LLGLTEMKIAIGRKAKAGAGSSVGSAVLDAPEEMYAPETETELSPAGVSSGTAWPGGGAAPAGALQRGFGTDREPVFGDGTEPVSGEAVEEAYVPRRGANGMRWQGLPRSLGGRIVAGCVAFGIVGAVAVAIAGVRFYLLHDERFLVSTSADIQIAGNAHLTRAQVLSVFGADLERNIFKVSLAERRADLERLPWVQHATVMRLLPDRIRVSITERTPVAFVRQGTRIGLVDAGGVLLDMPPEAAGDPKYSFPVLTGLSADDPLTTRAARMEIYKRFTQELDSTGEHLTNQLSEVDVSNPEDVKALIASGGTDILVHFGDEDFLNRFKAFEQHLGEWKAQYPKLASADMRYDQQIVLEMQKNSVVPLAGDAAPDAEGSDAVSAAPVARVPVAKTAAPKAAAKGKAKPAKAAAKAAAARPVAAKTSATGGVTP
jgi:cell division protein FtsQ